MRITEEQKPAALAALYNAAHARNARQMGFDPWDSTTPEEAADEIAVKTGRFDYLNGVCIKMDFTGDVLDFRLYDRDNGGNGTGARIVRKALGMQTPEEENMAAARSVLLRAFRSGRYS